MGPEFENKLNYVLAISVCDVHIVGDLHAAGLLGEKCSALEQVCIRLNPEATVNLSVFFQLS